MKKLLTLTLLASALALTACGGNSDSSGKNDTSSNTGESAEVPSSSNGTCDAIDNTISIQEGSSCTHSSASLNSGALMTYTCSAGRVSNGMITSGTMNLNGLKVQCAS